MLKEQEEVWDRLKYGMDPHLNATIVYKGNGVATKFHSGWITNQQVVLVTVDDVARSAFRDYKVDVNTIIFEEPPADNALIHIKVRG